MAPTSILVAHAGRQRYFLDCIAAAERFALVQVLDLGHPSASAQFATCREHYVHLSGKSVEYEFNWCIGRYFTARDHFAAFAIADGWLIDSDVILVDALPPPQQFPPGTYCALSIPPACEPLEHHASPHCSYWTRESLDDFCNFVTACYRERAGDLVRLHRERQAKGIRSAISDMILLGLWSRDNPRVFDLYDFTDGGMIDHNLRELEQPRGTPLKSRYGMKQLAITPEGVFAERQDGRALKLRALHFQGRAKMLIPDFTRGRMGLFALRAGLRHTFDTARLSLRRLRNARRARSGDTVKSSVVK